MTRIGSNPIPNPTIVPDRPERILPGRSEADFGAVANRTARVGATIAETEVYLPDVHRAATLTGCTICIFG
ncbi:MAG: hypothetical protein A2Z37_06290 [Chloroflexi bacterium RBG_19FT_COMBO_62_14]|nr:MAG: hypothetical protein A2Z37_06290 [Chloroflexi bacterium RBG_19FT_COMBO_62_14]